MGKVFRIILDILCILVIIILGVCVCYSFYTFFANVFCSFEFSQSTLTAQSFLLFVLCMIVSGIMSFYRKIFSKICFIMGLLCLLAFVLWYNYVGIFRPDLYVIF